ncbi:hypothetical protein [Terasakiella sp. SH-1]|uniref:hypothetical protein n=1 Tax=Terasakiella sp. SH-1 TaxID=2560057 RepID=UPI001073D5B0|nr:hypothetical protein [Terasakiella sp. SH-1]
MSTADMQAIAERLAAIRDIIIDREGEEVADQFEVDNYILIINIDGSGYSEDEEVFTLIQLEKGPAGMESLIACAVENQEGDSFIIAGEDENILDQLDEACDKVYRHWHWLDLPNALPGSEIEDEDDFDDEENF